MTSHFRHDALDHPDSQLRLLRIPLYAQTSSDFNNFKLETVTGFGKVTASNSPDYCAISYTWGGVSLNATLEINGQKLAVPRNTVKAIRAIQRVMLDRKAFCKSKPGAPAHDSTEYVRIWIDAVCIDQSDVKERSQQVLLMDKIYRQASEVFVWLGEHAPTISQPAVGAVLSLFSDCMQDFTGEEFPPKGWSIHRFDDKAIDWPAFAALYNSPWFGRVWTIQETVNARAAICVFGASTIPLYEVIMVAFALCKSRYVSTPAELTPCVTGLELAASRLQFKKLKYGPSDQTHKILRSVLRYSATDARDMIYGILGLCDLRDSTYLNADYSIATDEVFSRATYSSIIRDKSLEPLQSAGCQCMRKKVVFPTWALQLPPSANPSLLPEPLRPQFQPNDLDLWTSGINLPSIIGVSPDWKCLSLQGIQCDKIVNTTPLQVVPDSGNKDSRAVLKKIMLQAQKLNDDRTHRVSEDSLLNEVAEILTAGLQAETSAHIRSNLEAVNDILNRLSWRKVVPDERKGIKKALSVSSPDTKKIHRAFFTTQQGRMGIGPLTAVAGDIVCLFVAGCVPFVLRPEGDDYMLVGDAFVYGLEQLTLSEVEIQMLYKLISERQAGDDSTRSVFDWIGPFGSNMSWLSDGAQSLPGSGQNEPAKKISLKTDDGVDGTSSSKNHQNAYQDSSSTAQEPPRLRTFNLI